MSKANSTAPPKPSKPSPDFPLFPHWNGTVGRWAKKIRGVRYYFGSWEDGPEAALANYNAQKEALHAGKKPREEAGAVTIKDVANAFLNAKQTKVDSGELSPRTWRDYKETCDLLVKHLGKTRVAADVDQDDFAKLRAVFAKRWGFERVTKNVVYTRSVFGYAYEKGLLDRPVKFGPDFACPSVQTFRKVRNSRSPKLFTHEEIHKLLDAASVPMRAMILLGINCGFGNADCGQLPIEAVNLEAGVIRFPRPKTGVNRTCPLWPETIAALREVLAARPEPKHPAHAKLLFVTSHRGSWAKATSDNPVSQEMRKLLRALGINGRQGLGFYTLRHTFRTVADAAKDQPAADHIMGHEPAAMSTRYREHIAEERLRAVAVHVRNWLFAN